MSIMLVERVRERVSIGSSRFMSADNACCNFLVRLRPDAHNGGWKNIGTYEVPGTRYEFLKVSIIRLAWRKPLVAQQ